MVQKSELSQPKKLAILLTLSALGGISSLLVGYAGSLLSFIPLGSPVVGQVLAGLHVLWLVLVAAIVRVRGAATMAGAVKGAVEVFLPNHLGVIVLFMSLLEGFIVDAALLPFSSYKRLHILVAAGLSSASNVLLLQALQILPPTFPPYIYVGMYSASFCSGMVLGGFWV